SGSLTICLPPAGWLSNEERSRRVFRPRLARKRRAGSPESGVPPRFFIRLMEGLAMMVIIGIDPHKAQHAAFAIDENESEIGQFPVRAGRRQLERLLCWAQPFGERTWAIESAGGLGYLLAQQLVAAGEDVVDVPATLSSRVRVLGTGRSNKNDPNDARAV